MISKSYICDISDMKVFVCEVNVFRDSRVTGRQLLQLGINNNWENLEIDGQSKEKLSIAIDPLRTQNDYL